MQPRKERVDGVHRTLTLLLLSSIWAFSIIMYTLIYWGIPLPLDSDYFNSLVLTVASFILSFVAIKYPFAFAINVQTPGSGRKYQTSPLSESEKGKYLRAVLTHMEKEKPFTDNEFSLEKLSEGLAISPHHISQILNEVLQKNFYEFVDSYRIEEVKSKLTDPAHSRKKLLAIAFESGFNSKASFNRAFKQLTGLTPSEYKKKHVTSKV